MLRLEQGPVPHPGTFNDFVKLIVAIEGIYADGLKGRYEAQLILHESYSQIEEADTIEP